MSNDAGFDSPRGAVIFDEDSSGSETEIDDTPPQATERRVQWSQVRLFIEAGLDDPLKCAQWCVSVGLVKERRECRIHRRPLELRCHRGIRWYCGRCRSDVCALSGSVFDGCRLPLGKAVMLIHCYARGVAYKEASVATAWSSNETPVAESTIARWYRLLRDRLIDWAADPVMGTGKIGGEGMIVQVDEAVIGRRKYHRGRVLPSSWVVGLIDEAGEVRMEVALDRKARTLEDIILRNVTRGSIIHSDGWKGYSRLSSIGYRHSVVVHGKEFVAADGTHTQAIESQWRQLRRTTSKGGVRHKDLGEHLIEYMWRRKNRIKNLDPFEQIIEILKHE